MHRLVRILLAAALTAASTLALGIFAASPAAADACYTWNRTLSRGMSGGDVKQLQIRLAGWVGYGENLAIDGVFGARTEDAVIRFKNGYNLGSTTGVAGSGVFNKLYALQDADCTPIHFSHSEFNYSCGERDYTGGNVSAATAKSNMIRVMWQLEAMRKKLGGQAIVITSGFRSVACNSRVGGSSGSLHTYGKAADLGTGSGPTLCQMHTAAKRAGFEEILGPGYQGHSDHTHVGNKSSRFWAGC
ncbi:MAG: D-Ala-D-Ala carboxypeptidase family metallohydrolase [Micromonosporaceae bacterium]